MKLKMAAFALFCSAAMICSETNADLLGRMLGRGCGDCQTVSSCCDTPAPACGRNFGLSININIGMPGRLFRGGCGGGLLQRGCDTGCDTCAAPAVMPVVDDCGCGPVANDCGCGGGLFDGSLLGRLRGRFGGCNTCGAPVADCGCGAPVDTCGPTCDDGCGGGLLDGGLLGRLRGRFGGCNTCGAPVADCGCAPAPVMNFSDCGGCDTGCDVCSGGRLRGRVSGLLSRLKPSCGGCGAPAADCGCAPAPMVVESCGCDNAPACGCRGGRIRGMVGSIGSRFKGRLRAGNDCGCDMGCANSGCTGGCGATPMLYNGGQSMGTPTMEVAPQTFGSPVDSVPMEAAPTIIEAPANVPEATEGAVEVPANDGAYRQPVVDPSAFVIRRK